MEKEVTDSEILDAANTLLHPQSRIYYEYTMNSRMPEYNTLQRLQERLGSTQNSLSSLEGIHEGISEGTRRNCGMSATRRFFCLFVLFDLLFICLTWLLCMMIMGGDKIVDILKQQILQYSIRTSIFDIVLNAFCRFTILLLFYGVLQMNVTVFVAFTTLATSVFLICKVIYYSWNTASQPLFEVFLLLASFVIAWVEVWFLDFRVLPQELSALTYAQYRNLRSPVMRQFLEDMASHIAPTESTGNFYSPIESSGSSGNESDDQALEKSNQYINVEPGYPGHSSRGPFGGRSQIKKKLPAESRESDHNEYSRRGKNTLEVAWSILNDCDWKLQKTSPDGDSVFSKYEEHIGRVFLLRAKMNISAQKLLEELFFNVDKFTSWNKTVMESRRVLVVDEHTDITYQVSSPGGNGVISSRDFVILRHWSKKGDCFVLAGISIPYAGLPSQKQYVRGENGPCCWAMRSLGEERNGCLFEFLLNTNLKGWIPQYVLESVLTSVLLEYSACLKEHCNTINSEGST